jgi:hypothetical protein
MLKQVKVDVASGEQGVLRRAALQVGVPLLVWANYRKERKKG